MNDPTTPRVKALMALYELGAHLFAFQVERDPDNPHKKKYGFPTAWQKRRQPIEKVVKAEHVGLIPGSLGLTVCDVDTKSAKTPADRQRLGNEGCEQVQAWAGTTPCIVRTPSKGAHLFYRRKEPHSKFHIPKGEVTKEELEVFGHGNFVELYDPERVLEHLDELPVFPHRKPEAKPATKVVRMTKGSRLERSLHDIRSAEPGQRNHSLAAATTRLVGSTEDTPEARNAIREAYAQINPDDAGAVEHAFETASAKLASDPYRRDPNHPVLTHRDMAEAFDERGFADPWRWVDERAEWRYWREGKWSTDEAKSLIHELLEVGQRIVMTHNRQGELVPAPTKGGSTSFAIGARLALAGRPRMNTRLEEWDADGDWVGAPDGHMLNLRTREVREATPDDLVTRYLGTLPGDEGRDVWERYLEETIPDETERAFTLRMFGLALSGRAPDAQLALFFSGPDASGKSLLLDTIAYVFGDFAVTAPTELIFDTGRNTTAFRLDTLVGRCVGARLVNVGDAPEGSRFETGTFKQITGDQYIQGRRGNRMFPVLRTWTIACATNHLPAAPSGSVERRMAVVQAPRHHEEEAKGGGAFPVPDRDLGAKLRAAAPAILSDLLAEAFEPVPGRPTTTYGLARIEAGGGDFRCFIRDCVDRMPGVRTEESLVMRAYNDWRTGNEGARELSKRGLRELMLTQGGFSHVRPKPPGGGPRPFMFEGAHLSVVP